MQKFLAIMTATAMVLGALQPAWAQGGFAPGGGAYESGYQDGYSAAYRDGYRAGYDTGRGNRRYDDTDYSYGYGPPRRNNDQAQLWRQNYTRTYTYNDDNYYRECRTSVDPGGVIAGALIGGLLGNALGQGAGRGGATIAGVIVGGAFGAALTRNLDCEDRSYAYRTYYDGFNAGRANTIYHWRNPRNGHYGDFHVGDYYRDRGGFRCASFTQQIFIAGRPQAASGRACQQPDGTWTIVG